MNQTPSLSTLLGDAGLDQAATSAMMLTADTLGPAITAGLGDVTLDDITTAEVLLVQMLIDNSGSIEYAGNTQAVRDGHNLVLDALKGAKKSQAASVLISCRYLNDVPGTDHGVLYPYRQLDAAEELTRTNYNPNGGTPLYEQAAVTLTSVAAKMAEFEQGGVAARSFTFIISDGGDTGSHNGARTGAADVAQIAQGMIRTEQHIIGAMGIDDGSTDFRQVFSSMGVPDQWIRTAGNTPSEIRKMIQFYSQSIIRASQTANLSQVALGGFGAP